MRLNPSDGPLKDGEKVIFNDLDKSNLMNTFFANIGKNLSNNHPHQFDNSHYYRVTPVIENITSNLESLEKSFKAAVKQRKACGPDEVTSNDLKLHEDVSI